MYKFECKRGNITHMDFYDFVDNIGASLIDLGGIDGAIGLRPRAARAAGVLAPLPPAPGIFFAMYCLTFMIFNICVTFVQNTK